MILNIAIIILTCIPIISSLLLAYQTMRAGFNIWGRAPIHSKWLFYLSKGIVFIAFTLSALAALSPNFYLHLGGTIQNVIPSSQRVLALIFLLAGNLLLLAAQYELSIFTRIGLPSGPHALCTSGVYKISRNPMFTSLFFFFPACFMLNPSVWVLVALIFSLIIHWIVIKAEKKFLADYFGDEYKVYQSKTAPFL